LIWRYLSGYLPGKGLGIVCSEPAKSGRFLVIGAKQTATSPPCSVPSFGGDS